MTHVQSFRQTWIGYQLLDGSTKNGGFRVPVASSQIIETTVHTTAIASERSIVTAKTGTQRTAATNWSPARHRGFSTVTAARLLVMRASFLESWMMRGVRLDVSKAIEWSAGPRLGSRVGPVGWLRTGRRVCVLVKSCRERYAPTLYHLREPTARSCLGCLLVDHLLPWRGRALRLDRLVELDGLSGILSPFRHCEQPEHRHAAEQRNATARSVSHPVCDDEVQPVSAPDRTNVDFAGVLSEVAERQDDGRCASVFLLVDGVRVSVSHPVGASL